MPAGSIPVYRAVALQVRCDAVNRCPTRAESQAIVEASIARISAQVRATVAFYGPDTKLFVLPEYVLTGFPMGETAAQWIEKACVRIPGPEIDRFAALAGELGVFIAGNAYEQDDEWPGVFFQASWCVGPAGLVLKYRRLNSLYSPSPHDFWTAYCRRYSMREIFPVADTTIGRLAAIASEEILYPEVARCLMLHGAEVFLHSTGDVGGHARMPKQAAKVMRAVENLAYVVSANAAGISGIPIPQDSTNGHSMIVDYRGLVLAEAEQGESVAASAEIDIEALARYRRQPGMGNLLARQRLGIYAPIFADGAAVPADQFEAPISDRRQLLAAHQTAIDRLVERAVIRG